MGLTYLILLLAMFLLIPTFNRLVARIIIGLSFIFLTVGVAQLGFVETWASQNLGQYFTSIAAYGAGVIGAVEHIRQKWLPLEGNKVLWMVFVVGVVGSIAAHYIGLMPDKTLIDAILFGLGGSVSAYFLVNTGRAATRHTPVIKPQEPVTGLPMSAYHNSEPDMPVRNYG